jgi:hypothetical protein
MPRNSQQYATILGQLGLRLNTNHNVLKQKPKEFLAAKLQCLKSMNLDTTAASDKLTAKQLEGPYELSMLNVTANEAHKVGGAHVQLSFMSPAYISKVSLSTQCKRRTEDTVRQVFLLLKRMKVSFRSSVRCATYKAQFYKFGEYSRLVDDGIVKGEMLSQKHRKPYQQLQTFWQTLLSFILLLTLRR